MLKSLTRDRNEMYSPEEPLSEIPEILSSLSELEYDRRALVGRSYYYIRAGYGSNALYRLVIGGGGIYSDEPVDHYSYGISWDDLDDSVRIGQELPRVPGCYCISPLVEKKLRALLDA